MPKRPEDAKTFQQLHREGPLLILANAWDAASARVIAEAGARAVATSSAAVAWAHGYADGHHLPVSRLLVSVAEIARVVSAPISVDMEGGYSDDPDEVGENVAAMIEAGAVGMNLEDGLAAPDLTARKIAAARAAADRAGVDFYINARTDVYLKRLAAGGAAIEESIARGNRYKDAGASGLFLPGAVEATVLKAVADGVDLPLNAMMFPGLPPASELVALGVRRLSAGGGIMQGALAKVREMARAFLAAGDSAAMQAAIGAPVNYNKYFQG
jgi:2-methylisocitrate lyase-like PEP mutase family enzyme